MLKQHVSPESFTSQLNECGVTTSAHRVDGKLPNLIVIGAMKASTTSFYELINRHPNIWFPDEKEPHYFTSPDYGQPEAWQSYIRLFESAPSTATVIGEASTGYSKLPHFGNTPRLLRESLGRLRLIYLIRDPVDRTISNFQHSYLLGHDRRGITLAEAICNDPILIDASCYARQIRAYWDVFDRNALLIINTDQLHADPAGVMQRVEAFLEVPAADRWQSSLPRSNSKHALGQKMLIDSVLPTPLLGALRRWLPGRVRSGLKRLAPGSPELPLVTADEKQLVFERVADDLRDLVSIMGDEIASWPSVELLRNRQLDER